MSSLSCCWPWLLAGLAAGWLLWQLFDKMFRRDGDEAGARWKRDYDTASAKLAGMQTELNASNGKYSKLQGEFDANKASVGKLQSDLDATASTVGNLRSDLDKANAGLSAKTAEASRLSAELADLRAKLSLAEGQAKTSGVAAAAAGALAAAGAFGFAPQKNGEDDLIIIEGIGPKIKELLHADGIKTFKALAETPIERVQGILDAAGPNFRLANPASWAKQARMCADGNWEALKKYQDDLNAGVDRNAPKA
jgi:predicted flap endonuclease-1-like 5' DNA nuclease